ncbi:hypothetical protein [Gluconacetobacter asukensis]|uniref:Pectate lyase superfamily protein domain-containing protein n=1 Tax=Gluconacetobacter asukensis TaxID=1017181 RepID=A0A7W4P0F3_9PROT|nr:hypothetical protein [Gluconacetobacter asukensis]MBB2172872.1 hypothetical protein [Gluconacetobacter asukensis]
MALSPLTRMVNLAELQEYLDEMPANNPAGTVGEPGIAFANDQTSGLFRSADGSMGIAQGGKSVLNISPAGAIDISVVAAGLTTLIALSQRFAFLPLAQDLGAVGDGVTDASIALMNRAVTAAFLPPGTYLVNQSCTISMQLVFSPGAMLKIADGCTVTLSNVVDSGREQPIFAFGAARTGIVQIPNSFVSLGWFSIARDGSQDVGPVVNSLIASAPAQGRTIYVPDASRYLIATTIDIQGKPYITIRGEGRGERSNVDSSGVWVGGGSQFVLGPNVGIGITDSRPSGTFSRTSGLVLQDFSMSGYSGSAVVQTGISIQRDGDGLILDKLNLINFNGTGSGSCCVNIYAQDTAAIRDCWMAESTNCLAIGNCIETSVEGCQLGAQPTGVTINCSNGVRVLVSGCNIFPDGQVAVLWTNMQFSQISDCIISTRFTGAIVLYGCVACEISSFILRAPNDLSTSWTAGKSQWAATNYDPINRDELTGLIYLDGSSNDNVIRDGQVWSYMDATNATGLRIKSGASGNRVVNLKFAGSAAFVGSAEVVAIESGGAAGVTYLLDSCLSTQATVAGSVVTRYLAAS